MVVLTVVKDVLDLAAQGEDDGDDDGRDEGDQEAVLGTAVAPLFVRS